MDTTQANLKRWVAGWKTTGEELEKIRAERLAAMTDDQAREILADLMQLADDAYRSPQRWDYSGLVEQQAIFQRARVKPSLSRRG